MRTKTVDPNMPVGKLTKIKNFLPPPDKLIFPDEPVKVTMSLSRSSVEFFKSQAKRNRTKYQKMIRALLDLYVQQHLARR
ncbi:MAG: CopG family transcriptional regulator [Candidatus Omnitrophica bacterium]|nr:CopG family transcriptional regulator [Candidatus Omnitrophota bacterium]